MEPIQSDSIETDADTTPPEPIAASTTAAPETTVTHRDLAEWQGRELVDCDGERIGTLKEATILVNA